MNLVISIINAFIRLMIIIVIVYVVLGYFLDSFHPVRQTLGQIVEPLLTIIRRNVPPMGGLDWSPLILIILLQVIGWIIVMVLRSLQ